MLLYNEVPRVCGLFGALRTKYGKLRVVGNMYMLYE